MNEKTLVFFKPNITMNGEVKTACNLFFSRIKIVDDFGLHQMPIDFFKEFYNHVPEPDLTRHSTFCSSGLIHIFVLEGEYVIERVRQIIGSTNSCRASFHTLRGYFYHKYQPENGYDNFAHSSESGQAFERELGLFLAHFSASAQTINNIL
ncbi:MAG: nucleoside-diphosphate kinase [bacterium]